jgi:DDE domain
VILLGVVGPQPSMELLAARSLLAQRVLDVLVQRGRDKQAAKRLSRKLLKKQVRPTGSSLPTSLPATVRQRGRPCPGIEHRKHKGFDNRAENSHQPTRRRERQMKHFKSAGPPQQFLPDLVSDQQQPDVLQRGRSRSDQLPSQQPSRGEQAP